MCAVSLNKKALLCTAVALMMLMTVRCSTGAIGQPHLGRSSNKVHQSTHSDHKARCRVSQQPPVTGAEVLQSAGVTQQGPEGGRHRVPSLSSARTRGEARLKERGRRGGCSGGSAGCGWGAGATARGGRDGHPIAARGRAATRRGCGAEAHVAANGGACQQHSCPRVAFKKTFSARTNSPKVLQRGTTPEEM